MSNDPGAVSTRGLSAAPSDRRLGQALVFLRWLWTLDHALQKQSKRMRARIGVTGPQRLALRIVELEPGLSPGALAHTLQLHPSTVTGVLARLERRRLLERTTVARDRRRVELRLTARGRAIAAASDGSIERAVARTLRRTSPARVRAAASVVRSLVDAIEAL
jgi:DNA-binding MarR family transcriptional regulator